jgi:hypothetical protein
MRNLIAFTFITILGCSSGQNKLTVNSYTTKETQTPIDTLKSSATVDTSTEDDNPQIEARKDLIASYNKPLLIDTFFVANGKKLKVLFRYWCTMDSSILVPAQYNFDTNKDFRTHGFISDLVVLSTQDTLFRKQITKSTFDSLIDISLKKYATLLFPDFSIENDSIKIDYSITIPATDVGKGVYIKFGKNGNYRIGQ